MGKTKNKLTRKEKLAKDRIRKKLKYAEIKNNPELYEIQKEKEKMRYIAKKEKKKVVTINEMSERAKREQRRRWRKNSQKYSNKIKEQKNIQRILLDNSPPNSESEVDQTIEEEPDADPLAEVTHQPAAVTESQDSSASQMRNSTVMHSPVNKTKSQQNCRCKTSATVQEKLRHKMKNEEMKKNKFPEQIPGFKGTTKAHQVIWSLDLPHTVAFRDLSCFICHSSYLPCDHHRDLGVLSVAIPCAATVYCSFAGAAEQSTNRDRNDVSSINDEVISITKDQQIFIDIFEQNHIHGPNSHCDIGTESPLHIDSPTIFNNVGNMLFNDSDESIFLEETLPQSVSCKRLKKSTKVQILANIPLSNPKNTNRREFKSTFKSIHQTKFERFLQSSSFGWPSEEIRSSSSNVQDIILARTNVTQDTSLISSPNPQDNTLATYRNPQRTIEQSYPNPKTQDTIASNSFNAQDTNQLTSPKAQNTGVMKNLHINDIPTIGMDVDSVDLKYNIDMWVIVEYKLKNCSKFFVGKISETFMSTMEYKILFVRKCQGKNMKFGWPNVNEKIFFQKKKITMFERSNRK